MTMKGFCTLLTAGDEIDWLRDKFSSRVQGLLGDMRRLVPGVDFTFLTDNSDLMEAVGEGKDGGLAEPVVRDFQDTVRTVLRLARADEGDAVCLVDPHNPYLTARIVAQAVSEYERSGTPLISTVPVRVSPYYLERIQTIFLTGSVHLIDRSYAFKDSALVYAKGFLASLPFRFQWERYGVEALPGALFSREVTRRGLAMRPVAELRGESPQCLFIYEQPEIARVALPVSACAEADGFSLPQGGDWLLRATRLENGFCFKVQGREGLDDFQAVPFTISGPLPSLRRRCRSRDGTADISSRGFPDSITGFLFALSRDMFSGVPDMKRRFDTGGVLWQNQRNLLTGEPIAGRQNIPEVVQFSGDIVLGKAGELRRLKEGLRANQLADFPLPCPCIPFHSKLDVLRYRAQLKAMTQEAV